MHDISVIQGGSRHFEKEGYKPKFLRKGDARTEFAFFVDFTNENYKFSNKKGIGQPSAFPLVSPLP